MSDRDVVTGTVLLTTFIIRGTVLLTRIVTSHRKFLLRI